jgi:hypothetical protein
MSTALELAAARAALYLPGEPAYKGRGVVSAESSKDM